MREPGDRCLHGRGVANLDSQSWRPQTWFLQMLTVSRTQQAQSRRGPCPMRLGSQRSCPMSQRSTPEVPPFLGLREGTLGVLSTLTLQLFPM